ncbi:MAG: class I adenylate-forming enzyme family protein [Halioglobus sp.]
MGDSVLESFQRRISAIERDNDFPADFRELLDRAVEVSPDGGGLNFFDQGHSLNATEVRDSVYRLADGLQRIGVGKGSHVAVMLPNLIEFPLTWLALGVLGAVQIAVNHRFTSKELDYQLNDADAEFLVTATQFMPAIDGMETREALLCDDKVILVSEESVSGYRHWQALVEAGSADYRPQWQLSSDDLLSIQYTSGSTGLPKGCMLTQRSWIVFGCTSLAVFEHKIDNIMADHAFFYLDPQWQLVAALYVGARLHVPESLSASRFVERVKAHNINMTLFPRPIVGEKGKESDKDTSLKKILAVAAGAEGIRNIRRRFDCVATDGYGMTEVGAVLMMPEEANDAELDSCCGVAGPFRECRIVRENKTDCDANEPGELWVRGDGILSGYYNKPEATAEAFEGDWFRTGDLFIRNERGYYQIVGRIKDMIRRSSENISALEVEQALTMVTGVQQVAVVPVPDDYRGEEVKAYLLLEQGETPESIPPTKVLEGARERLAEYKVPRFIEYVTTFPYTPSQKVAKAKLVAQKSDPRAGAWDALAQ